MLKDNQNQDRQDPFENFFEEDIQDIVFYQKNIEQDYKSRAQKNKERIEKRTKHFTDPQLKKQKKQEQKNLEKQKMHQIIDKMTKEEARVYLDNIKKGKAELKQKVRQAMDHGQIIMIDLAYQQKMNEKQNRSLVKQVELIMRAIKRTKQPPSIHLCSFKGGILQQMKKMRYQFWALTVHQENVLEIAKKMEKKVIYLSPDAQECLQVVDSGIQEINIDTAFILGGLIDRTIIKDASLKRAQQLGIEAKKLPIRQFMKGRLCLNLDHVVSMICHFMECSDWKKAFDFAAPKRWKKEEGQSNINEPGQFLMEQQYEKLQPSTDLAKETIQKQVILPDKLFQADRCGSSEFNK